MTPEDMALQLAVKFLILPEEVPAVGNLYAKDGKAIAKHCAKVCCREIISSHTHPDWIKDADSTQTLYWKEVLKHLESI